jgi:hypothetical protein
MKDNIEYGQEFFMEKRKKTVFLGLLALFLFSLPLLAAEETAMDPLQQKLDKKLSAPFVAKGNWITDFDTAKKKAAETGKPIFAYFSRSYSP